MLRRSDSSLQEATEKIKVSTLPLPSVMSLAWPFSVAPWCPLLSALSSYITANHSSLVYDTQWIVIAVAVMLPVVHWSKSQWCAVLNLQ